MKPEQNNPEQGDSTNTDPDLKTEEFSPALSSADLGMIFGEKLNSDTELQAPLDPEARALVAEMRENQRASLAESWLKQVASGKLPEDNSGRSYSSDKIERAFKNAFRSLEGQARQKEFISAALELIAGIAETQPKEGLKLLKEIKPLAESIDLEIGTEPVRKIYGAVHSYIMSNKEFYSDTYAPAALAREIDLKLIPAEMDSVIAEDLCSYVTIFNSFSGDLDGRAALQSLKFALDHSRETGVSRIPGAALDNGKILKEVKNSPELRGVLQQYLACSCAEFSSANEKLQGEILERVSREYGKMEKMEETKLLELDREIAEFVALCLASTGDTGLSIAVVERFDCDQQEISRAALEKALGDYDLVTVAKLQQNFGIKPEASQLEAVVAEFQAQLAEAIEAGRTGEAATLSLKKRCFEHFARTFKTTESVSSVLNLEPGYGNKVMLFELDGKFIARGFFPWGGRGEFHSDILNGIRHELEIRGLTRLELLEAGGAYVSIPEDEGPVVISGKSEDYGECNKELLAGLLQKKFPDREVQIKQGSY